MVEVVPREQKDLEAAGKKGGLKPGTLTERDMYGYYFHDHYYIDSLFLLIILLLVLILHTETAGSMLTSNDTWRQTGMAVEDCSTRRREEVCSRSALGG